MKMAEAADSAALPRPEIADAGGCVTVRFLNNRFVPSQGNVEELTEQQRSILDLLDRSGSALALREIRSHLAPSTSERRLRADLTALKERGLVRVMGRGRGARWQHA